MKPRKIPDIIKYNDDVRILKSKFEAYSAHRHEFYEFEYILEGEGEYFVNGKAFPIKEGDMVFVTPMDLHSYKSVNGFRTITVQFILSRLNKELSELSKADACVISCDRQMQAAFSAIGEEREEQAFSAVARRNCLERILILFMRRINLGMQTEAPIAFSQIVGYINQNFRENLSLDEIAEKCGYSSAHFCRQFKKTTGVTFVDYLNSVRASHVKNLILAENMTITEICYDCGFGSVRSLNRAFLKKYGCSPMEYRKTNFNKKIK